jgi:hypothetical protein
VLLHVRVASLKHRQTRSDRLGLALSKPFPHSSLEELHLPAPVQLAIFQRNWIGALESDLLGLSESQARILSSNASQASLHDSMNSPMRCSKLLMCWHA